MSVTVRTTIEQTGEHLTLAELRRFVEATKDAPATAIVTSRVVIDQRDSHYRLAVQIAGAREALSAFYMVRAAMIREATS